MAKSAKKLTSSQAIESVLASLPVHRAGLPAKDSVTGVTTLAGNGVEIVTWSASLTRT